MNFLKRFFFIVFGKEKVAQQMVLLALASGALWAFMEVADEVIEGETRSLDERLILVFRSSTNAADPLGPVWFEEMARDVTALGSFAIIILIAAISLGLLYFLKKNREAFYSLGALSTGAILIHFLKIGFERPRPDLVPHHTETLTSSFPSGHSALATLTFLSLSVLSSQALESKRAKAYLIGMAIFVSLAVGTSRVYLGVHWPTDVLAGFLLGALWALLWRALELRFG